jgi:serine/threonine-protein kinase HipA
MLIAPGSSLGGARPKASVVDQKNNLWIAKFPSTHDNKDTGAWEMVVYELGKKAGLDLPEGKLQKFSGHHHTFLSKRFDRTNTCERIHFASAMTLLGYTDGADFHNGASYLEFAEFLIKNGANVDKDLEEIWRRIVFSICVKNTDDHLRNHGFLLTNNVWVLSPAFDINPVETGTGLKLNISETDNSLNLDLAMEVAGYFRLENNKAIQIIDEVKKTVSGWRTIATRYRISKFEQDMMSTAFWKE